MLQRRVPWPLPCVPAAARSVVLAVGCVLAALALAGCARESPESLRRGGTLVLALVDPVDLDPRTSDDDLATPFLALLYEGLVRFDSSGAVVPAHAASWSVTADGLTYTFALRRDWQYEDGTPVVAADYARALDSLFRLEPPSPARPRFWSLEGATARHRRARGPLGVSAPDPHTLVVALRAPDEALLDKLAQPRYAVPAAPPGREARAGRALATGAYRLAAADGGQFLLVRNPRYRGDTPGHLDTIRVRTGVSARRAALGLASGAVGLVWPVLTEYRTRFARDPRLGHAAGGEAAALSWMLALNCELAPTARQAARQAVARAVNRQRVVGLLLPLAAPWRGFAPGGPPSTAAPGFDPAAAQAALAAAHYERGIELPIQVPRGSLEWATARGLVTDLGRAGVYGEARSRPRAEYLAALRERRGAVASLVSRRAPTRDALSNLAELLLNRSLDDRWGGNVAFYRASGTAAFDSLLLGGLGEREPAARALALAGIEARLAGDLPYVPIARVQEEAFFRRPLGGVRFHPRYGLDLARIRWEPSDKP